MNERAQVMDEATLKFGLLMESAQVHQRLAESHLERLRLHTQDLDGVVRDEIRRTLVEELHMLTAESQRAAAALKKIGRGAASRRALWSLGVAVLCTGLPMAVARWVLPSPAELAALKARRDELSLSIAQLEKRGGRVDWKHCGESARLCVRIDRKAPIYGEKADYFVLQGY